LLRSLAASERADVGFRAPGLALVSVDTAMVRYSRERSDQFWRDVLTRVRAMPGVTSVALASPTVPFEFNFNQKELRVDSRSYPQGAPGEIVENIEVTAGYLGTLGVSLVDGRDFAETDHAEIPDAAIVNETMARRFWPAASAVGHTFQVVAGGRTYRIVGVAANHKRHGVLEGPSPYVYFAAARRPAAYNYIVARTTGDAAALVASIRRELLQMEPGLVFMVSRTMEAGFAASLVPARVGAWLATSFSALGTLLAAIGLYGVIAFSVARRTREIGVRMALGAHPRGVLQLVMRHGAALLGAGLIVGAAIAAGVAHLLSRLLFSVRPLDPAAWLLASLTLTVAAAAACYIPARRAMRVDPMVALRTE
jgi:putative ABC transport system permease protein